MESTNCPAEIVSAIANSVMALAAVMTLFVAVLGLVTWRYQLTFQADSNAARELLVAVLQLRNAIREARNSFISPGEMDEAKANFRRKNGMPSSSDVSDKQREQEIYEARWAQILACRVTVWDKLVNAEVQWGEDVRTLIEPLFGLSQRLRVGFSHHVRSYGNNSALTDRSEVNYGLIWAGYPEENDDVFEQELKDRIREIEQFLGGRFRHVTWLDAVVSRLSGRKLIRSRQVGR